MTLFISTLVLSLVIPIQGAWAAPKNTGSKLGHSVSMPEAPIKIERGQARRLFIVGFEGSVTLIPQSKGDVVVKGVKYMNAEDSAPGDMEALSQLVIKTSNLGDTIEVRAQLPPTASDWGKWAQGKRVPSAKLEITAPDSMNLEVYVTRGDVKVPHWRSSVTITSQEGKLSVEDVTGEVNIHSMYGAVKVDSVKGPVSIENFTSQITAENINGKLKIKNFAGDTHVRKINGPSVISSQKGGVFTAETVGSLDVQTGIAAIHIGDHRGSLTGHSDAGAITAHLIGAMDARLRSNTGPLTISVARSADASVSMYSAKGTLQAPSTLESKRSPSGKVVKGNLGAGDGHIRLSSESGDLVLKLL